MNCCGLSSPLKMTLKESRGRMLSWWQNLEGVGHVVLHFVWKDRWPKIRIDTES